MAPMAEVQRWEGASVQVGERRITLEGWSAGLTLSPPTREVISSKEKSKYKFPPAALPCEFSTFFRGQAPPPNLSPFLQFPISYTKQDLITCGCMQGWETL